MYLLSPFVCEIKLILTIHTSKHLQAHLQIHIFLDTSSIYYKGFQTIAPCFVTMYTLFQENIIIVPTVKYDPLK